MIMGDTNLSIILKGPLTEEERAKFIDELVEAAIRAGKPFRFEVEDTESEELRRYSYFRWMQKGENALYMNLNR